MLAEFQKELKSARGKLAIEQAENDYSLVIDLVQFRIDSGLTQVQVAELLGISQQAVSKFENLETDPRLSTIRKYATAINALVRHEVSGNRSNLKIKAVSARN